jgi:phosphotransferase system HPr (HPr) family protein
VQEGRVVVRNALGIHVRPAGLLVMQASAFRSEISIGTNRLMVNAKSIMGVLMLAAETGSELTIRAEGPDEREAVASLTALIDSCFRGAETAPGEAKE